MLALIHQVLIRLVRNHNQVTLARKCRNFLGLLAREAVEQFPGRIAQVEKRLAVALHEEAAVVADAQRERGPDVLHLHRRRLQHLRDGGRAGRSHVVLKRRARRLDRPVPDRLEFTLAGQEAVHGYG